MIRCNVLMLAAGAAILAGSPSLASAQDTTASEPHSAIRIPIGKDRTHRVSAATVARTDTLRLPGRVDTVTHTVTNTVTRVDTVIQAITIPQIGGFYTGLAVGPSFPAPSFDNSDQPGFRVEVPFGIDPVGIPLGVRVNLGYSRYTPATWVANKLADAQMMNADADLKLRLMSVTPYETRIQLYGIGGVSYVRFRDILESASTGYYIGNNGGTGGVPAADDTWHHGLGWNAGAGAEIGKGRTNFFFETRFSRFQGVASNISNIPMVVGVTIY